MSANRKYSSTDPVGYEITLTRDFAAPRERVFKAWTEEKQIKAWWGPGGFTNPVCQVDARVGGLMDIHMRSPDGTIYPMKATFTEIVPPERIVFTSGALDAKGELLFNILTTVTFAEAGGKTRLTLTARVLEARAEGAHHIGGMEMGWSGSLDKLAGYVKENGAEENNADREIVIEHVFDAPVKLVWSAITDLGQMKQWYFPMLEAFRPEVGFETTVDVPHNDTIYRHLWKVTEVVPGRKIAYSWKYANHPGDSIVAFELFDEGGKTRLRLTHSGLETFAPETNPDYARSNFIMGWTDFIGTKLKDFVGKSAAAKT